jgi:Ig-like domain CHU_C associated/Dockerin type I domain
MKNNSTKSHEPQIAHTNRTTDSKAVLKGFLLAFLLVCGHFTLGAATITVTSGADAGAGTLRAAIASAVAGDDIAFFGVTTVTLTSAALTINKTLTINGGTGVTITRSGATEFRIFYIPNVSPVSTVVFNKLSITNGKDAVQAGGVYNAANLTLNDCIIANNESGQGGGLQNDATMTLNRCIVHSNRATVSYGGGLDVYGTTTTLNNCVFANNQAVLDGGAIDIDNIVGSLTVTNCTIVKNSSGTVGGGIDIFNGNVTLKNTIVAENTAVSSPNITGNASASSAYNLIGTEGGNGGLTNGTNNNLVGVSPRFANSSDPDGADNIFGTADDGLRLLPCSPAVNTGNNADAPSGMDIVGNSRIFNTTVDMGVYELQSNPALNAAPTNVSVNNTIICSGSSISLTATCNSSTLTWYTQATGGTAIGTGSPLSFVPVGNTTFYAACTANGCESNRVATLPVTVKISEREVFGSSSFANKLYAVSTLDWHVTRTIVPSLSGKTITGITAISQNPANGLYYAILKVSGVSGRILATIIPTTGVCTEIGNLGDKFSSLTFTTAGVCYAVTGNGATVPETLYRINLTNAAKTFLATISNGADGDIIAYNPDDGFLYHWSGNGTIVFEKIDLTTLVITNIPISGSPSGETFGAVYNGGGIFLTSNINSRFNTFSTSGLISPSFGSNPDDLRGLAFYDDISTPIVTANAPICSGVSASLSATCQTGVVKWYDATGTTLLYTGSPFVTPNLTANTTYKVRCELGSCISTFVDVVVTVGSSLSIAAPTVGFILCQGGETTISTIASGGSGTYQYSLNGGTYQTSNVFSVRGGNYTITAKDGIGCTISTALTNVRDGYPALQCPTSISIDAAQMGANGSVPTSVSGNVNIVSQCLTPISTAVTDQVFDVICGVIFPQTTTFFPASSLADAQKVIVRAFTASIPGTTFSCYQTIYVRQNKMEDIVFPANVTLTCPNLRTDPTDAVVNNVTVRGTGSPNVAGTILNATAQKGFTATYTDVRTTTPTGFTIQRAWTVTRCAGGEGNTRTVVQTITVPTCTTPSIAGSIGREDGTAVPATTLLYNIVTGRTDSTTGTNYAFANLLANSNIRVKPTRPNTDWTSGVTMLDVSLLSRHLLDINPLASPYSIISADVNADGEVDAIDMLLMQRLILRLIPAMPNNNSWRFILKDYVFRNARNPFVSDFPEILVIPNLASALANGDFVAIKVGDINQSAGAVTIRGGAKAFMLNTEDIILEKGKTYNIPIQLTSRIDGTGSSVNSLQFTLNVDKTAAKIESLQMGDLPNFTDNNTGLFQKEGIITAAWYRKDGQILSETDKFTMMTVMLKPTITARLSEIMTINSAYTEGVAYDAKGTGLPVQLSFGNQKSNNEKAILLANRPNPFSNETTLSFILPEASVAKLTVCDLLGKVLMTSEKLFAKGLNEVVFNATSTPSVSSGIFVVRLQTATGVAEQKIVLQR